MVVPTLLSAALSFCTVLTLTGWRAAGEKAENLITSENRRTAADNLMEAQRTALDNFIEASLTEDKSSADDRLRSWILEAVNLYRRGSPLDNFKGQQQTSSSKTCDLLARPGARCVTGTCASGAEGTLALGAWTYRGAWGPGNLLQGPANMTKEDGTVLKGTFRNGCLEGPVTLREGGGEYGSLLLGVYSGGRYAGGPTWLVLPSLEGFLYVEGQPMDSLCRAAFTGDQVLFIYPDYKTALVGRFVAGTMLETREAEITDLILHNLPTADSCTDRQQLLVGEAVGDSCASLQQLQAAPRLPSVTWRLTGNKATYKFDPSTETHATSDPLVPDPMEVKYLTVRKSLLPGAGQGLFATRPLKAKTIVGYYNGVHLAKSTLFESDAANSAYLIDGDEGEMIDIPPEFRDWNNYQATSSHKLNHGDNPNVSFFPCFHPRFGKILCTETIRDVEEGEELRCQYHVMVDEDKMKGFMNLALTIGHMLSGKPKKEFVQSFKPYVQDVVRLVQDVKMSNFVRV